MKEIWEKAKPMFTKKFTQIHFSYVPIVGGKNASLAEMFARFLVHEHSDSIYFNPDVILKLIENVNEAEKSLQKEKPDKKKGHHLT